MCFSIVKKLKIDFKKSGVFLFSFFFLCFFQEKRKEKGEKEREEKRKNKERGKMGKSFIDAIKTQDLAAIRTNISNVDSSFDINAILPLCGLTPLSLSSWIGFEDGVQIILAAG